jgi:1-acyl-sn-glycerol-3-phosphate acyltransferase
LVEDPGVARRTDEASATVASADRDLASRLLGIIRDLAVEVQPHRAGRLTIHLDSDLDRDVGLDSLGRAELLLRLDRNFKVRLPERLIGDAETPRDLLRAVIEAGPAPASFGAGATEPAASLPEAEEPQRAATLLDVLAAHVQARGNRPHIRLWLSDQSEQAITYCELDSAARAMAAGLLERGIEPGDRVAIMLPTGRAFFEAFFGVLMSGGIPVPIYPPFRRAQVEDHLRRQAGILKNAAARLLITDQEIRALGALLMALVTDLRAVETPADLARNGTIETPVPAGADTTALIQYTSGSTGDPKGVVLSHSNLLANIRAMGEAIEATSRDGFVSWLPLYHDMGLIGAWLGCLYYAAPTAIMPPLAFLANPARWLWSIHRHRATLSAAPNFAFELCLRSASDEQLKGLDLSCLRMVMNGAESVSPHTIRRFSERLRPYGFRPEAMAPVYGLAECSVGLAFPPVGRKPIIDRVQRATLSVSGKASPAAADDRGAIEFVACGRPLPRHQIRIVDAVGRELPDRHQGRLQFKGPSATGGYFRSPAKTKSLFDGEWLESGDLAYIVDGDVFITGRIKDMIIRAGRHVYPHELEEFVGHIEGVRKGCVVAFASYDHRTGTELLVLVAETRLDAPADLEALRARIAEASLALLDRPPDLVLLVPPHTVPKTSSGKIRRSAARALYESGSLAPGVKPLWWQIARIALSGAVVRVGRTARVAGEIGYAAYWWAALAALGVVVWLMVALLPRRSWRHAALRGGARAFFRTVGIPLDVVGKESSPKGPAMIVANHASYLDGLVLSAVLCGEFSFVAKDEFRRQFVAGVFLRRLGTSFVRRTDPKGGVEDTASLLEAAREGRRIVTFPEGTFTRMPGLLGFRLGAFLVAAQAGLPVYPIAIRGTRAILRSGQWLPRRGRIAIFVERRLEADGSDFAAALRLRDKARALILARIHEPDLAHETVELPQDR